MNSSVTNFYAQKYFKDHGEKIASSEKKNFSANVKRNIDQPARKHNISDDEAEVISVPKSKVDFKDDEVEVITPRKKPADNEFSGFNQQEKIKIGAAVLAQISPELGRDPDKLDVVLANNNKLRSLADKFIAASSKSSDKAVSKFTDGVLELIEKPYPKSGIFWLSLNATKASNPKSPIALAIRKAMKDAEAKHTVVADVSEGAEHVKNFARRNFRRSDDKKLSEAYAKESTKEGYDVAGRSYRRSDLRKNADKFIELHEKGLKGAFLLGMVCNKSKDFGLKGTVSQDPANFEKFCNQCWDAFEEARKSGKIVAQEASASLAWIDRFTKYTCSIEDMKRASRVMKVADPFQACFELGKMRTTPKDEPDNSPYWPLDKDPMKCFMHTLCQLILATAMIKNKALADGMNKFTNLTVQLA